MQLNHGKIIQLEFLQFLLLHHVLEGLMEGLVTDVIVEEPGQGFLGPQEGPGGYPVLLELKEVLVRESGINYNCGVDELTIEPANGAELDYECDTFGRIIKINIINPGVGFTQQPTIRMPSATGVNFEAIPLFEIERDPVAALTGEVPLDKLVQVTDLVGSSRLDTLMAEHTMAQSSTKMVSVMLDTMRLQLTHSGL